MFLALNPFYLRMVLWDYTSYVALPCCDRRCRALADGLTSQRRFWLFFASGALLSASAFANALSVSFVVPLVAVEVIGAIRRGPRELGMLLIRGGAGAARVPWPFRGRVPGVPRLHRRLLARGAGASQHSTSSARTTSSRRHCSGRSGSSSTASPDLCARAAVPCPDRRARATTVRGHPAGRLAQYAIGYVALLWLYRFAVTSSVLETWWAYSMTAISMCFAVPSSSIGSSERAAAGRPHDRGRGTRGRGSASLVIRSANAAAVDIYETLRDNATLVVLLLAGGALTAAAMRLLPSWGARAAATASFFALVAFVALTPARYIGIYQTGEFAPDGHGEVLGYRAAYDMSKLLEGPDQPDSRILLWTTLSGLPMIAWTDLPHQFSSIESPEAPIPALSDLSPQAEDLVRHPTTDAVLFLSEDPADMSRGLRTLRRKGISASVRQEGAWGDGHLHYRLVDVPGPVKCCERSDNDEHAAAIVAQEYLDAHTARDAAAICRVAAPEVQLTIAAGRPSCAAALQPQLAPRFSRLTVADSQSAPRHPAIRGSPSQFGSSRGGRSSSVATEASGE